MNLRKTIHHESLGIFRIFEVFPRVFRVTNQQGETVDEFTVLEIGGGVRGVSVKQAFRHKPLRAGVPELVRRFVAEMNAARLRD